MRMRSAVVLVFSLVAGALAAVPARALLLGRDLDGSPASFEAYYDDVLDVTWLADTNLAARDALDVPGVAPDGGADFSEAQAWIAALNAANYFGFSDWRLPVSGPTNGSSFVYENRADGTSDVGYGMSAPGTPFAGNTRNEMAHLYYVTLGNPPAFAGSYQPTGCFVPGTSLCLQNPGPFAFGDLNGAFYWSSTVVADPAFAGLVHNFDFTVGFQGIFEQTLGNARAWAVRDGDVALPEPSALLLLGVALAAFAAGRRVVRAPFPRVAGSLLGVLAASAPAHAARIGTPVIDLRIFGITDAPANDTGITGPGLHGPLLAFATELDLEDGGIVRRAQIGNNSDGSPSYATVGVADDGDIFWAAADTPNHYQNSNRDYIGSESVVRIYQSYTKDTDAASLTYTYSRASLSAFITAERGPQCQLAEPYCLRAGIISLVEVFDAAGSVIGSDANSARLWSDGSLPERYGSSIQDGLTTWPWQIEHSGAGGVISYAMELTGPARNAIDLSGIDVGEEFTVVYTLWTYALDTAADAGLYRSAVPFAEQRRGGRRQAVEPAGEVPVETAGLLDEPDPVAHPAQPSGTSSSTDASPGTPIRSGKP